MKTPKAVRSGFLAPARSVHRPATGMIMAEVSRYAVATHEYLVVEAKVEAISGKAVATTVRSSATRETASRNEGRKYFFKVGAGIIPSSFGTR